MNTFTGSQRGNGSFDGRIDATGEDWCIIIITAAGNRFERYCSVWQNQPCKGLTKVYEILREHGFIVGTL